LMESNFDVKHPIILPRDHSVTALIVRWIHIRLIHAGVNDVMCSIRERFWIPKLRSLVRKIINECVVCKRMHGRTQSSPTAPLPSSRVTGAPPFDVVGIDFAGPLTAKRYRKVYICLFTCAVTRAIHLELCTNLEALTFIAAFRRFVSRRGIPSTVYYDNARTFKRASIDLQSLNLFEDSNSETHRLLLSYFYSNNIIWILNVPSAPWWGGFWERMVQSGKVALKKVLGNNVITYDELHTMLCEIECILNSRPLTVVENDEFLEPLSPSHFLVGKRLTVLPDRNRKVTLPTVSQLMVNRWTFRQRILSHFWRRWSKEYLLRLRSAHLSSSSCRPTLCVGDVLVQEPNTPRLKWPLGRVLELHKGRDGHHRAATIQMQSGSYQRAVQNLVKLEVV